MTKEFDPAPHDRHAADPREESLSDADTHAKLEAALIDSFPASDPPSATQPSSPGIGHASPEADPPQGEPSLWHRLLAVFRWA